MRSIASRSLGPQARKGLGAVSAGLKTVSVIVLALISQTPGLSNQAAAQPTETLADGRSGRIEFASVTVLGPLTVPRRIAAGQRPAVVSGELTLPPGAARVPAMVIAHGSSGVSVTNRDWARLFVANGIAAFVVDSFTGRGVSETATNQDLLSTWSNAADAMKALALLSTHPRIDPSKIGVIGGSKGGQVALYTAFEEFASGLAAPGQRFALHFALYPYCGTRYIGVRLTGRPVHFLLGESDDYTPAGPCVEYAAWFRAQGAPVEVKGFPGAHHGFDRAAPPAIVSNVQNFGACAAEYDIGEGRMRRLPGREIMSQQESVDYFRTCWRRGATVGGDPRAFAETVAHVLGATKAMGW